MSRIDLWGYRTRVIVAFLLLLLGTGCQQVKEIPEEIPDQLPNPVRDFTEKDKYMIGLNWYQQRNYGIAAKFWKPLSEEGDCDAQYAMGLLYFEGLGVGRSYKKAVQLWSESADQGQAQAQISLGAVYSCISIPYTTLDCKKGCGEEKDLVAGYKWFGVASEIGSPHEIQVAQDSMNRIISEMTPEQISEGDALIEAWEPNPTRCEGRGLYIVAP